MIKGLLQSYSLSASEVSVVRVDNPNSSQLRMQPNAAASDDGFVVLSGDEVIVEYDNFQQYKGYYWEYGSFVY